MQVISVTNNNSLYFALLFLEISAKLGLSPHQQLLSIALPPIGPNFVYTFVILLLCADPATWTSEEQAKWLTRTIIEKRRLSSDSEQENDTIITRPLWRRSKINWRKRRRDRGSPERCSRDLKVTPKLQPPKVTKKEWTYRAISNLNVKRTKTSAVFIGLSGELTTVQKNVPWSNERY